MSYEITGTASQPAGLHDVAIIGMAVRFPEADDLEQFLDNLRHGRDSVRSLSTERKTRTSLPLDQEYQLCGYIEDIDTFDHEFFDIAKGEAKSMSPQHRLLLQVAYQAVENAGYDPAALHGVRGSVYIGDTKLMYGELARTPDPTTFMGSHVSAMAGRLSRFFHLRGPAAMVDSSCSSSLVAVHLAVNDLLLGEAELALVGCASLNLFADRLTGELDIGIRSADGKTRCFSAEASGTGSGEAVATIVLKRLDHALRDGDVIHAVIKSVAVNNVGGRSSTLTAPDSVAEAEVIERAWAKARIDPTTISYIEAHGTATRLGDPIEIEAIDLAFSRVTPRKRFCAVSSVKSNLGHTWSASGLVGLIKAVLSLRHHVLFPNLHSTKLSPLIDFDNSAVVVNQELTPWQPSCSVRRAGVSSFGVMGTNAHAILEEAPPRDPAGNDHDGSGARCWIPISARSAASLAANLAAVRRWVDSHPDLRLQDIQRTLVSGRGHFGHRFCATAASLEELAEALAAPSSHTSPGGEHPVEEMATALLVSGTCEASLDLTRALCRDHPEFDRLHTECQRAAPDGSDVRVHQFAFQYAFQGLLRHIGLRFRHMVGEGVGKLVIDVSRGRVTLAEALRQVCRGRPESVDLDDRVDRLLARLAGERILFVETGPPTPASRLLAARGGRDHGVVTLADCDSGFPRFLRHLYLAGVSWSWDTTAGAGHRIELPSYQFQRIRCWMDDVVVPGVCGAPVVTATGSPVCEPTSTLDGICEIWKEILGLDSVDPDTSFFSLGGDSISGLLVINRIQTMFDVELDEVAIFDHETPIALATHVDAIRGDAGTAAAETSPSPPDQTPFPASPAQLQIWLASRFDGGSVAFNLTRSFRLTGRVDLEALRLALGTLASRHDALRATFTLAGEDLVQQVTPAEKFMAPLETAGLDAPLPDDSEVIELAREFAGRRFDLEGGPLLRAQLLRFQDDQQVLTLSTHHIVADGWSLGLLLRDLAALYVSFSQGRPPALPSIGIPYHDRLLEEQARADGRRDAAAAYWLAQFPDVPPLIDLPVRIGVGGAGGAAFRGTYRTYTVPRPLWRRLEEFAQAEGGTPFTSVLSVFTALFSQCTDDGRLVLGTSVTGRGRQAVEDLVGMLVRTLPLRLTVSPGCSLADLHRHVRSTFSDALHHLAYPYEELVHELQRRGVARSSHLFNVLIELEQFAEPAHTPLDAMAGPDLQVTPLDVTLDTSILPLNVMLSEQADSLDAVIRFDTGLFDDQAIDQLWSRFLRLLEALLARPSEPIDRVPLLTEPEQQRVRTLGHRVLELDSSVRIHHGIERFAVSRPDQICVSSGDDQRTYAQLNARANRLARLFMDELQVGPGDVVALIMDRSILMVESILALWKCGAAYLPIDPGYPSPFVHSLLRSSGVRVAALDPRQAAPDLTGQDVAGCRLVALTSETAGDRNEADLKVVSSGSSLAYVIYTSGSTGAPKGVMVEHLGMLNHLHAKITDLSLQERSVVAQTASNSFDISVWQMFAAPFVGGRTVIYDEALQLDPLCLATRLESDHVTVLEVVPSYLDTLLDAWERSDRPVSLRSLELLVVTGEAALPRLVNRWLRHFPATPVVNAYGPTEASDDVTHHLMTRVVETDSVPLGRPIPNTLVYVLDERLRVVPEGVKGEICVSGIAVARGYLHAPEETARVFMTDPFEPGRRMYRTGDAGRWTPEGTLEYLGRRDSQVKVRGFRVDVGEIERRVSACPGVKAAAVITRKDAPDQLCAYVVMTPSGSLSQCRTHLAHQLPRHMVPADLVEIERMPLTYNGKVDRKALQQLDSRQRQPTSSPAPPTDTERALTGIWEQVLGRDGFGITDRFFDVGGNSLRAIQVLSRVRSQLGVDISLDALFSQPTIAGLARLVSTTRSSEAEPIVSRGGPGAYEIALIQNLLLNLEEASSHPDAFNRNDLYELRGHIEPALLKRSFAALLERHESLRTTFGTTTAGRVQVVHPPGALPLPFRFHDLTHDSDPPAASRHVVERRIRVPFDITREPLVRADLLRTGESSFFLLVSMHQLASDGRSAQALQEDWTALYESLVTSRPTSLPPLRLQYKDAAHWRNQRLTPERIAEHRAFWRGQLDGASSIVPLQTDHPRPSVTALDGARLQLPLPVTLTRGIADLARQAQVTEFVVAGTAVALLLLAETGLSDVTLGTYTRGRNRTDLEDQIGFYINTVPLRLRLLHGDDVRSVLTRAQRDMLRAFEHEDYPYEWTMRELGWQRGPERSPLFDVMLAMDDGSEPAGGSGAVRRILDFEPRELPRRSKEGDLLVVFGRTTDHLEVAVTYNVELFSAGSVRRFAARLREILEAMVDDRPVPQILDRVDWA